MKECASVCLEKDEECPFKECKYWINYGKDHNCDLIAIERNGEMTLRDIADRLRS